VTVETSEMLFGLVGRMAQRKGYVRLVGVPPTGRGNFGMDMEHPIVINGDFMA